MAAHALAEQPSSLLSPESEAAWKSLRLFNLYRATLAALFIAFFSWNLAPRLLGHSHPMLFEFTALAYFLFSVLSTFTVGARRPPFPAQVLLHSFVDIVAITLMMHASGGVSSGLGILLVVAIAGGSLIAAGRVAILFAALASLAVLTEQIVVWMSGDPIATNYPQAGMLGVAFFATATLAYVSARRIRASEALAARREVDLANLAQLSEHIIQRMQSGIVAADSDGRIRLVNESARRLLGLPVRAGGARLAALVPPLGQLIERWRGNMSQSSYQLQPPGQRVEVVASFAALGPDAADGVLVFLEDASAMNQRAQQLKLASLGRLTASIAHEIRNPLGAMSHAGQLLDESPGLSDGDRRLTRIIRDNSTRMNEIIENVLQLSRRKPALPESFALAPWLEDFAHEMELQLGLAPGVCTLSVEPADLSVRIDPGQLAQVLRNLCENGLRHAGAPPRLTLEARISEDAQRPCLEVRDNGPGISAEAAEHVFEPFFTTRVDGTGLGLYIARELCEANQASLHHVPAGAGACFRITFADPRRAQEVEAA